ncbi:MAG: hypothetical protein O7E52_29775 [Candidatus Poribacteria bacterium]|nr:hypothetical protein [Candidatus Poribacteria bacterium]
MKNERPSTQNQPGQLLQKLRGHSLRHLPDRETWERLGHWLR